MDQRCASHLPLKKRKLSSGCDRTGSYYGNKSPMRNISTMIAGLNQRISSSDYAVYQFRITLKGSQPSIWRRIQVPGRFTFLDLHRAVRDAMGWEGCHAHQFLIKDPHSTACVTIEATKPCEVGKAAFDEREETTHDQIDSRDSDRATKDEAREQISDYFSMANRRATYVYDMQDSWTHGITLERILTTGAPGGKPRCVSGKRACPPEGCGGVYGYELLLAILADPTHEEYREKREWIGENAWKPEHFDPKLVRFS